MFLKGVSDTSPKLSLSTTKPSARLFMDLVSVTKTYSKFNFYYFMPKIMIVFFFSKKKIWRGFYSFSKSSGKKEVTMGPVVCTVSRTDRKNQRIDYLQSIQPIISEIWFSSFYFLLDYRLLIIFVSFFLLCSNVKNHNQQK